jgi:predicted RNA-binding Zn-ribbon protein involved in translation (DUF1610 family)
MCKGKLEHLNFFCGNCGAVAIDESHICNPKPIADITADVKASWEKAKENAASSQSKMHSCKICGQPVEAPGHYCDRITPFTCEYCGVKVSDNYHLCRQMMGKFKFFCKNCGRLGIKKTDVCAPRDL